MKGNCSMKNNRIDFYHGIPIFYPNRIVFEGNSKVEIDGKIYDGFYVSYNSRDVNIYGCDTTALVLGQMQKFYILNGNHASAYENIAKESFQKCMEYFLKHAEEVNSHSDMVA